MLPHIRPDEIFPTAKWIDIFNTIEARYKFIKARIAAGQYTVPTSPEYQALNAKAGAYVAELNAKVLPYASALAAKEPERAKKIYRAWKPPDNDLLDFAKLAAIVVAAGFIFGPMTAAAPAPAAPAAGGGAAGGTAAGTATATGSVSSAAGAGAAAGGGVASGATLLPEIVVTGSGISAGATAATVAAAGGAVAVAPWSTQNVFATEFTGPLEPPPTFKDQLLTIAKKEAIERGTDYAMEIAAEYYAEKMQKKMAAEMEAELRAEMEKAQAEYAALIARGVAPETAASQASGKSGKFGALIALAVIAALLLSRR